ncbi:hypothetical protein [Streptomyces sp. NPDC002690]
MTTQVSADKARSRSGVGFGKAVEKGPEVAVDRDRPPDLIRVPTIDQIDGEVNEVRCERPLDQPYKSTPPLRRGIYVRSHQLCETFGPISRDGQQFCERSVNGLRHAQPAFPPLIVVGSVEPLRQGEQTADLARHGSPTPCDRLEGLPVRQGGIDLPEDRDDHIVQVRTDPIGG